MALKELITSVALYTGHELAPAEKHPPWMKKITGRGILVRHPLRRRCIDVEVEAVFGGGDGTLRSMSLTLLGREVST